MTIANEARPADYAPLARPGHNAETVLEVEGLHTYLFTRLGVVKAVDDVSFAVRRPRRWRSSARAAAARR